jgi:hypothetical protein
VPAWQVLSPKFKTQYQQKKKKERKHKFSTLNSIPKMFLQEMKTKIMTFIQIKVERPHLRKCSIIKGSFSGRKEILTHVNVTLKKGMKV